MQHGFIAVREIEGVWWLVDGAGRPFVTLGVNHVQPDCWLAPYNRAESLRRYGSDLATQDNGFNPEGRGIRRLVDNVLATMDRWHFNTLGIHTVGVPSRLYRDRVFYAVETGAEHLGSRFRFGQDRFPDMFSDAFAHRIETRLREVCAEHRDSANLIGYCFTDIPRWYFFEGDYAKRPELAVTHPWTDDLRSLPAGAPGKDAWVRVLRTHHGDAVHAARVYGADFRTWEQAATLTRWPSARDVEAAMRDSDAMLAAAASRWYDLHVAAIRRHDPHHLILGDKLHSPHRVPGWLVPIVRRSVDVLFIQWYEPFAVQSRHLPRIHDLFGKPILNGDGCAAFVKPPHQTDVKGYRLGSAEEVGRYYTDHVRGIMGLPWMLGWHHCGFVEQWDGAHPPGDPARNENGFMDPFERPYDEVVARVQEANRMAHEWHRASAARP